MAITWTDTPLIKKIKLPSGNEYFIADREARQYIEALEQAIAGGVSFIIAWDGTTAPDVTKVPEGVVITYNGTTYTGTLEPADAAAGAFYLVKSSTAVGISDTYDEYVPIGNPPTSWEKIGDTQIDLSDVVTEVVLNKDPVQAVGKDATFKITQPTISLATGATAGAGVISVATGISSVTQPTVSLSSESSSATGRAQVVQSLNTTKLSASASGGDVAWNNKDQKTVLTGVKVTAQPTVSLTANTTTDTGRITYVESQGTATTTKISATANITGKTGSAASSVTPTTKKLATTTVTGVSGSTTPSVIQGRTSQTTSTGATTASTTNTDILKGATVTNEVLTLGAATLNTQTTYSANAPGTITVPTAASSATTVATGSVTTSGSGADIVTDVAVGDTITVVTAAPTITIASGSTGDVTVATGIGAGTTKYLSATASGTAVGANGTANVIGSSATLTHTNPTITLANGSEGDVTVANGGTTKYIAAAASGAAVTPTTTNIKATASGGNTAWNDQKNVNVLSNNTTITVTKGNV